MSVDKRVRHERYARKGKARYRGALVDKRNGMNLVAIPWGAASARIVAIASSPRRPGQANSMLDIDCGLKSHFIACKSEAPGKVGAVTFTATTEARRARERLIRREKGKDNKKQCGQRLTVRDGPA